MNLVTGRPFAFEPTFVDSKGVTHEALDTDHRIGVVSLCGQLQDPVFGVDKTLVKLRAYAYFSAPESVDCMVCLIRRVRLNAMIENMPSRGMTETRLTIELDIRITSWE